MQTHSPSTTPERAKVSEIFSSLQGEGIYWGRRHLFLRFFACNMKCVYCDEEEKTFHGPYEELDVKTVRHRLLALEREAGPHQAVSLTGGEPLLHAAFLTRLLPILKEDRFCLYLETNGTCPEALREVLPWVDIIAMDIKLPSATRDRPFWREHRAFLELAQTKDLFVKIVVTAETLLEEIEQAAQEVACVDRAIPFVLQPVTPCGEVLEEISDTSLFAFWRRAREVLRDVRMIPQLHKLVGIP